MLYTNVIMIYFINNYGGRMRCRMLWFGWVCGLLLASTSGVLGAWDLENGDFSEGTRLWVTNWGIDSGANVTVAPPGPDGEYTLMLDASGVTNQNSGVIAFQDFSPYYFSSLRGLALRADIAVTNLPGAAEEDFKAFTKMEFFDRYTNLLGTARSGQYDASKYAASNRSCRSVTLVANANELQSFWYQIKWVRAGCFLYRFDTNKTELSGHASFRRVALGRASELDYSMTSLYNTDFEFDHWCWMNNMYSPISSTSGWSVADIDGDGDKEVRFNAEDLTGQYAGRLWVQDMSTTPWDPCVVWTNDITLSADVAASNLTQGLRAFIKLEFGDNSAFPGVFVSSEAPETAAMTNMVLQNVQVTMRYTNLLAKLAAAGKQISDVYFIRSTLFLMQFDATPPPPSGFAYFDNVRLSYQPTNSWRSPQVEYTTRFQGDQIELSWGNCSSVTYYHIQRAVLPSTKWSNVVQNVFCGLEDQIMTNRISMDGSGASYRVIKGPYMQPLD